MSHRRLGIGELGSRTIFHPAPLGTQRGFHKRFRRELLNGVGGGCLSAPTEERGSKSAGGGEDQYSSGHSDGGLQPGAGPRIWYQVGR